MFENKKILIFGMARSGYEVARLLAKHNNTITITDLKKQDPIKVEELISLGVTYIVTDTPEDLIDETIDYVVKNPGIRKDHPAVLKAKGLDISVINELEVAYNFMPKDVTIIGITGSNGKTTITTMIYEILKKAGYPVHLAGNIGVPLSLTVQSMKEQDILVIEISDHQLLDMYHFKTNISILTNLSEVHLDFHGNYENYKKIKQRIFNNHTSKDISILNKSNLDVMEISKDIPSHKFYFSSKESANSSLEENWITLDGKPFMSINEIVLKGNHNYENIMCVLLALSPLKVDKEIIKGYLKEFRGVEHRNEYVGTVQGRRFYNDSKSTNIESTITALSSFTESTILLLGGLDRGHRFEPLNSYMGNVKHIVCFGETKERIKEWADQIGKECTITNTLKEATQEAYASSSEGDVIVLSPACASWDQYSCFEDRGNEYKMIIKNL